MPTNKRLETVRSSGASGFTARRASPERSFKGRIFGELEFTKRTGISRKIDFKSSMRKLLPLESAIQKANSGLATTMTPSEMDVFREFSQAKSVKHKTEMEAKQESARAAFSQEERELFAWLRPRWDAIAISTNDEEAYAALLREASSIFRMPPAQIQSCYLTVH